MELVPEIGTALLLKLISFLLWTSLYIWSTVKAPEQSPEWCSRVITLLHGTVATVIGLSQCGARDISISRLTMEILPRHYALMLWSWGYFAFDLLWCLLYGSESVVMLLHHISALAAITAYMQKENTGCVFSCTLSLLEVTNPLLQTRWFLKAEGYSKTKAFYIIEMAYLALFLSIRGILGTYLMYVIWTSEIQFEYDAKIFSLVLYIVSIAFIYDILGYAVYKYKTQIGEVKGFFEELGLVLNELHSN